MDVHPRVRLFEFDQHGVNEFFQHRGGLFHRDLFAVDPGDGQQILHHPVQPLGILADLAQKLQLLLPAQGVVVFDHRGAGPVNGRQRGAQVVRDGPQEVRPHLFRLALHPQLLLFFDAGGQGAGHDGHHQHHGTREQVFRQSEIKCKIGRAERKVDRQHSDDRRRHAPEITFRIH